DFQGGFTRSASPDAAGESAQRVVALAEARQGVLELSELHLQLAVAGFRVLGKDVEDELAAIDDLQIRVGGNAAGLSRGEVVVEDEGLGVEIDGADHHLLELALAQNELGVEPLAELDDAVDHRHPGG